jgi:hypothetical protein
MLALAVPALVLAGLATDARPVHAQSVECGTGITSVGAGGFETELVGLATWASLDPADLVPWQATEGIIEVWGSGHEGVDAFEGSNFAELNANEPGTLYQDIVTTPGATMTWTLRHRGRGGEETMRVLIGDAAIADVHGDAGWDEQSTDLVDGTDAWGEHSGTYVVPAAQTCTRFAFRAIDWVVAPSYGNFLDAISFTTTIPAPERTARPEVTPPPTDTIASGADPALATEGPEGLALLAAGIVLLAFGIRPARRRFTGR